MITAFLKRYSIAFSIVALVAAFWSMTPFVTRAINREFWLGTSLFVWSIVAVTWLPTTWKIVRDNELKGSSLLILGVSLAAWQIVAARIYAIVSYAMGRPAWLYKSDLLTFLYAALTLVGVLIMCAVAKQQLEDGDVQTGYLQRFTVAILAAMFMVGATFGLAIGYYLADVTG